MHLFPNNSHILYNPSFTFFKKLTAASCSDLHWLLIFGLMSAPFPLLWFPWLLSSFTPSSCWSASSRSCLVSRRAEPFRDLWWFISSFLWCPPCKPLFSVLLSQVPPFHLGFDFQKHVENVSFTDAFALIFFTFWAIYTQLFYCRCMVFLEGDVVVVVMRITIILVIINSN